MSQFTDLIAKRRSTYVIGKNTDLSHEEIVTRIRETAKDVPTANNSQTTRLVVVFGEENIKLWDYIMEVQKEVMPAPMWEMMSGIMAAAKNGIGTVLFFEDTVAVEKGIGANERAEVYKQHNDANSQYAIWLALTDLGLGANLQHMNIGFKQGFDKGIKEMLHLPDSFEMVAQMPFGSIELAPQPKEYIDTEEQVRVIGD